MAKNKRYEGRIEPFPVSDASSGDPVCVNENVGVAISDSEDGWVLVDTGPGRYELSVKAVDDSGDSAIAWGDKIYYVEGDDPPLSKKSSGVLFGYARGEVAAGQTATIEVKIPPKN